MQEFFSLCRKSFLGVDFLIIVRKFFLLGGEMGDIPLFGGKSPYNWVILPQSRVNLTNNARKCCILVLAKGILVDRLSLCSKLCIAVLKLLISAVNCS